MLHGLVFLKSLTQVPPVKAMDTGVGIYGLRLLNTFFQEILCYPVTQDHCGTFLYHRKHTNYSELYLYHYVSLVTVQLPICDCAEELSDTCHFGYSI